MKKFILLCLLGAMCSCITWATTTSETVSPTANIENVSTPQVQEIPSSSDAPNEALLKDNSTRPDYALDYNQFGLNTYNYDQEKIWDLLERKATGVVEKGITSVELIAMFSGLVSLVFIIVGIFTRGFKWALIGVIGLITDLIIYAIVGNWPMLFINFKNSFWS